MVYDGGNGGNGGRAVKITDTRFESKPELNAYRMSKRCVSVKWPS
jgi:hypothetical protein